MYIYTIKYLSILQVNFNRFNNRNVGTINQFVAVFHAGRHFQLEGPLHWLNQEPWSG